jgi:hypothetical protein
VSSNVTIIVEGPTEQTFIRDFLAPGIANNKPVYLTARRIGKRGGDVRFVRALNDIEQSLKERSDTYVTTMFDYYAIDPSWPGMTLINERKKSGALISANEIGSILAKATQKAVQARFPHSENRFIPYFCVHEFEALLFSDPEILRQKLNLTLETIGGNLIKKDKITAILSEFSSPEDINNSYETAPSKRIQSFFPHPKSYKKIKMGLSISKAITLEKIRMECSHFDSWVTQLENLEGINQ